MRLKLIIYALKISSSTSSSNNNNKGRQWAGRQSTSSSTKNQLCHNQQLASATRRDERLRPQTWHSSLKKTVHSSVGTPSQGQNHRAYTYILYEGKWYESKVNACQRHLASQRGSNSSRGSSWAAAGAARSSYTS